MNTAHVKRWLTSIVALPFLIMLIYKGKPLLFAIFICIISLIALWEYFRIVLPHTGKSISGPIPLLAFITGPAIILISYQEALALVPCLLSFHLIITGLIAFTQFKTDQSASEIVAKQIQGVVYVPLLLSYLVLLRNSAEGVTWIFFLLFIVFFSDIGAYYVGSWFGRHKLCPAISPGKTIEGAIGGLATSVGIGLTFRYFFLDQLPLGLCMLLFLCIGIAAPLGDLFESFLKRTGGIKDSGTILPGHGGLLDRIDALLFTAPVVYFFKEYML